MHEAPGRNLSRSVFAIVLLVASASEATLIERDLFAPGDALVTRDSDSGLDWLDVTEPRGLSASEITAGAGGWASAGWRHATTSEVCGLLAASAAAPSPCPGSGYVGTGDEGQLLLDLLGISAVFDQGDGFGGTLTLTQILAAYDDEVGDPAQYGMLELSVDRHTDGSMDGTVETFVGMHDGAISETHAGTDHLLVRSIPEPVSGLLLALGLGALAIRRCPSGSAPLRASKKTKKLEPS